LTMAVQRIAYATALVTLSLTPSESETDEPIPLLNLSDELAMLRPELQVAFDSVLDSATFILGPQVRAFEQQAASYLGSAHAIGVNSGTDALLLLLRAAGIEPGDEVITTPFTFFATAESISMAGATPVFVDIDAASFNIDLDAAAAACTSRTKAIVPVHLFGNPVDIDALNDLADTSGLAVIEDAAQAFGARWNDHSIGTQTAGAAFSFFPSKNLGGLGDGGLVTTSDAAMDLTVRKLRTHGSLQKYRNEMLGYNSRLDELQAAFLQVKLRHLDKALQGRRRVAAAYDALICDLPGVTPPSETSGGLHVYHQYTIRVLGGHRDVVASALGAAGIGHAVYYPVPCHKLPVYAKNAPTLPVAEAAAAEVLSLPIWPTMTEKQVWRVVNVIRHALA
jgi:dTDP-4-amino-4,6-dideoxygalactose transaminase